ncbi:MAG: DUF6088 family protein [Rhodobacteraceae bacterium]|nr:DUF6088 family protein [Paracoccaceae bacterium]MCY4251152.1 DUF6088 family protein [Paracoccaceae bacterium]
MSTAKTIRHRVMLIPRGKPFTTRRFLKLGSRAAVDKTLSRLAKEGVIQRIVHGMYVRPRKSRFIGNVMPSTERIVEVLAKEHGETIQVNGAEAALRFRLSTQVPAVPIYHTSGPSRDIKIGKLTIRLKHVSNRKLCLAGKHPGLALAALWYLGKKNVNSDIIGALRAKLTAEEFATLKNANIPTWMVDALARYDKETAYA